MNKKDNDLLSKLSNNKVILFLIPNLIVFYQFFYYYNHNRDNGGTVLFYEVIISCLVFFVINLFVYLFLKKALNNKQKVCCIMCFISFFYFIRMCLIYFLIFIILILFLVIIFKYFIKVSLDEIIGMISFISIMLFSFTFLSSLSHIVYSTFKSKSFDYEMIFVIDDKNIDKPNIYWIHCDGMMSQDVIKKYYYKDIEILSNYFTNNDYYYNSNASLVAGHSTQRSLNAMFNPYYYDNFYKEYLLDLEETFLNKKDTTDFILSYNELEEKRMNNELFQALKEIGYETIAIADYTYYTSFYVDKYYDFYYYDSEVGFNSDEKELRYIYDNNKKILDFYLDFRHIQPLFYNSLIYPLIENVNFLNHNSLNYSDLDLNNYPQTKNTTYWFEKAIFKGINHSYDKNKSQFTFIDFKNCHMPFMYNSFGEFIEEGFRYEPHYYLGNYIYASSLLVELLDYIKMHDDNAIIIVQGDHGIHMLDDDYFKKRFNINQKELQEIRNSVINAVYVPEKYRNGEENVLGNPLNISRYLINNYVGENYKYIK